MNGFTFPESCFIVQAYGPAAGPAGAVNGTPVSLKNVHMLWAVVSLNTVGTSAACAIVPQTDALVAFGSAISIPNAVNIWTCVDVATDPELYVKTSAVNYTTVADALHKVVIFEINPASFETASVATEVCFRIRITTMANTDFVSIVYVIEPRYQSRILTAPTYIAD